MSLTGWGACGHCVYGITHKWLYENFWQTEENFYRELVYRKKNSFQVPFGKLSSNNVVKDLFTLAKNGPRLECIQGENNVCIIYYTLSTLYAYKYFYTSDFLYKWLDTVKAERDRMFKYIHTQINH